VPIDFLEGLGGGEIRLRCSAAEFDGFDPADEEQRPAAWEVRGLPLTILGGSPAREPGVGRGSTSDFVPVGGAEICGGDPVYADDTQALSFGRTVTQSGGRRSAGGGVLLIVVRRR
jgi:hypothetical protein